MNRNERQPDTANIPYGMNFTAVRRDRELREKMTLGEGRERYGNFEFLRLADANL